MNSFERSVGSGYNVSRRRLRESEGFVVHSDDYGEPAYDFEEHVWYSNATNERSDVESKGPTIFDSAEEAEAAIESEGLNRKYAEVVAYPEWKKAFDAYNKDIEEERARGEINIAKLQNALMEYICYYTARDDYGEVYGLAKEYARKTESGTALGRSEIEKLEDACNSSRFLKTNDSGLWHLANNHGFQMFTNDEANLAPTESLLARSNRYYKMAKDEYTARKEEDPYRWDARYESVKRK